MLKFVRGAFFGVYQNGPDGSGEDKAETDDTSGFYAGEDEDPAENDRFYGDHAEDGRGQ